MQSEFNLLEQELRLIEVQRELLATNQDEAVALIAEVNGLVVAARNNAQGATAASSQAILEGRTLLLSITAMSVGGAFLIAWLLVGRVLLRRIEMLSDWMRRMAGGDLDARVEIGGNDEVADMAAALDIFRQHALEIQRLNLVEELAEELQDKNEELETVLDDLRRAQDQIVMQQKLAALGELTAGVAHEIRNPLNFVKNFSESSQELLEELREALNENAGRHVRRPADPHNGHNRRPERQLRPHPVPRRPGQPHRPGYANDEPGIRRGSGPPTSTPCLRNTPGWPTTAPGPPTPTSTWTYRTTSTLKPAKSRPYLRTWAGSS